MHAKNIDHLGQTKARKTSTMRGEINSCLNYNYQVKFQHNS